MKEERNNYVSKISQEDRKKMAEMPLYLRRSYD